MLGMLKANLLNIPTNAHKKLFDQVDPIAKSTKFAVRKSKGISPCGMILALFKAVIEGNSSFNQLATFLSHSDLKSVSRQAVWKRINPSAIHLLSSLIGLALNQRCKAEGLIVSDVFGRVLIEDSTQCKVYAANHEEFPSSGNQIGSTSGCKFDITYDILTGNPIICNLHLSTTPDQEIGKDVVDLLNENDLLIRDRGYFCKNEFSRIESKNAFWITRVPSGLVIKSLDQKPIETILSKTKKNKIEMDVILGVDGIQTRMIAIRADEDLIRKRKKERDASSKNKKDTQQANRRKVRDGWHIIVTNIPREKMECERLFSLYRIRWQIEITFRAWKQSTKLEKAFGKKTNPLHLEALMLAAMLLLILTMKISNIIQLKHGTTLVSIEKLSKNLTTFIQTITTLKRFLKYEPDIRHVASGFRQRQPLAEIASECLS